MLNNMTSGSKITLETLQEIKSAGKKFSMLTCYDWATARIMDEAGVEVLLVGDSAGEVVLGLPSTRETPPDFLIELTAGVRRGASNAFVMADLPKACMPDGNDSETLRWARRFIADTGADALKMEVTGRQLPLIRELVDAGIPIVAHLGLLPQEVDPRTGYRARGKTADEALALMKDAEAIEQAGVVMLLLEAVASEVAHEITTRSQKPVIGCVAGPHCDGTVVVVHDMIGWGGGHPPQRVKQYTDLAATMRNAFAAYVADIHTGQFPTEQQAIHMTSGEYEKLTSHIG
jgi:3-methyl-2-oxobutanoate hydroxymethyltransferase